MPTARGQRNIDDHAKTIFLPSAMRSARSFQTHDNSTLGHRSPVSNSRGMLSARFRLPRGFDSAMEPSGLRWLKELRKLSVLGSRDGG